MKKIIITESEKQDILKQHQFKKSELITEQGIFGKFIKWLSSFIIKNGDEIRHIDYHKFVNDDVIKKIPGLGIVKPTPELLKIVYSHKSTIDTLINITKGMAKFKPELNELVTFLDRVKLGMEVKKGELYLGDIYEYLLRAKAMIVGFKNSSKFPKTTYENFFSQEERIVDNFITDIDSYVRNTL